MTDSNTIAAISTPQGLGGIGVIRISGDNAIDIASCIFFPLGEKKLTDLGGYSALYGHIKENDEVIDEAVALVFRAPHSYTGENVVELSCHGGLYVTKRVLRAALNNGAETAKAGEFTKRAFLNGKLGLTEAESVMDIISAKGKAASKIALSLKDGNLRKRIDKITEDLISNAAHLSAWADYPEEDIPEVSRDNLLKALINNKAQLIKLLNEYDGGMAIKEGIDTVIVGRPNVGKSTLMNLLSGCERSIVTDIPGTTRDIIEETVILGDVILRLSDTAGLRNTENPVEKIGVLRSREKMQTSGLVFAIFDSTQELNSDDIKLIDSLKEIQTIAIINKTDLPQKIDIEYIEKNIKHIVYTSAKQGDGLDELTKTVAEIAGTSEIDPSAGILANERQRIDAQNALSEVENAISAINIGMTLDAVTVSIELAIESLLDLTGERASEAVVNGVFSKFCVGK